MLLDIEKRRRTIEWFFNLDHSDSYYSNFDGSIAQIFDTHWDQLLDDPEIQMFPLRPSIIKNIDKMIRCAKHELGYDLFQCPQCLNTSFIYHTYKSRFCSSCGVKYMNERADSAFKRCFDVPHRHITFTIDSSLRDYFRKDRSLLNILFASAAETLVSVFSSMCNKGHTLTPGFMLTLHTFGRDLKWNPHIHALLTEGGYKFSQSKLKRKKKRPASQCPKCGKSMFVIEEEVTKQIPRGISNVFVRSFFICGFFSSIYELSYKLKNHPDGNRSEV